MKNPFGKTTDFDKPHAIYKGGNGFEWRILKTYKAPDKVVVMKWVMHTLKISKSMAR